jgi:hypothetical protein
MPAVVRASERAVVRVARRPVGALSSVAPAGPSSR